jgi:polysaccharide biosynthesis protein PslG
VQTRRWLHRGAIPGALVCLASAALIVPATAAASDTIGQSVRLQGPKVKKKGHVVVFGLQGIDAERCAGATLKLRNKSRSIDAGTVQGAVQSVGKLKARLSGRWLPKHRMKKAARRTRLKVTLNGGEPAGEPSIGLITNAQGSDMRSEVELDKAARSGVRWLREDFDWSVIEPRNDSWHWSRYDHLLSKAAARGMRVLPLLAWTPSWAGSAWNQIPADPTEFAEFTAAVVSRYGPGGSFWDAHPEIASFAPEHFELWNEPYLDQFSAGGVNPGRYARLVKAAASAGHAANSAAKYLLQAEQAPSGARHTFIDGMYAAVPDLNSFFDAVAVHPYSPGRAPDALHGGWGFTERLEAIRAKFVSRGAADKPLWVTEIGWSTCPSNPDCVTEQQQAAYLQRMFDLLRTNYSDYVRAAFVYHRRDTGTNPTDAYDWYGLERANGAGKPAYDVFRAAVAAGA